MLKNYLKIAFRNLWRYKGFSLLNIISLTLGIAFTLLIGLWVHDEWSYNRFHENLDDLYMVRTNMDWGGLRTSDSAPGPFRTTVKEEVPEIKAATRLTWNEGRLLTVDKKNIKSVGIHVDDDFLKMFTFPLIDGDLETALNDPKAIVLTKSLAEKLFGTQDPIGLTLKLDNEIEKKVTAVVEDVPRNSELQFTWLASWIPWEEERDWAKTWGNVSFKTYVQLVHDAELESVNKKIAKIGKAEERALTFFLQPFSDTYLYANYRAGKQDGGRIEYVRIFFAVAVFLLIIACINFMNLATARSSRRAKEIGVRKTVGATRSLLRKQFFGEALLLSSIAFLLALLLTEWTLSWFNSLFEKEINIDYTNPVLWVAAIGLVLITGLMAGSYPAFLLSTLKPVKVLKGDILKVGDRSAFLRKGLVTFQFVISGLLIVATLTIHQQINFIKNKNLGIDRNDLFYMVAEGALEEKTTLFKQELEKSTDIRSVTLTGNNPMDVQGFSGDLSWPGKNPEETVLVAGMGVGDNFLETMGLELIEGRPFSKDFPTDTSNYIVNEAMVNAVGLENPIGTEIDFWNGKGKIVGVLKDYHMQSLHVEIRPMVLIYSPNDWFIWIKPESGKTKEALAQTEEVIKTLNPGYPFEYQFADAEFEAQYQNETLIGNLANAFGIIAIIISCLGLLGLAAYSAERRRKEIGIRKVLGASVTSIVELLSKDFIHLILIALSIALPLGWYLMQLWLKQYAYRIDIQWWVLALAGVLAIGVTFLTVGFQSVRAALRDPVESLRNE